MQPFKPLHTNSHFQTIAGHLWRRRLDTVRYPVTSELVETEPGVQVLVESQTPECAPRGHIVMVHGLEGSGEAGYMRSLSQAALEAGFAPHRFHMRTCGGTEHLCQTLYHAGLTCDLRAVLEHFAGLGRTPAWLVGFSLGGNVVLKLAGELGEAGKRLIAGVCAVSTPVDLGRSVDRLARIDNRLYEWRFVRRMRRRLCRTGRFTRADFAGLRTVRDFDDRITAPSFGFESGEHYYRTQSAIHFLEGIRVDTLIIQAKDDTFVPSVIFEGEELRRNPCVRLMMVESGGHLGFVSRGAPRFWADCAVLEWIQEQVGTKRMRNSSEG
jgi:predicted alpha/beta-fold hydrolase